MTPTDITLQSRSECQPWLDELKAYLDGELSTALREKVDNHLKTCPACREELEMLREIEQELRADEPAMDMKLDSSLRSRILAAASEIAPEPEASVFSPAAPSRSKSFSFGKFTYYGGAVLTVALITLAGVSVQTKRESARRSSVQSNLMAIAPADGAASPPAAGAAPLAEGSAQPAPQSYARHLDGSNYAVVDGHVKWFSANRAKERRASEGGFTFGDDKESKASSPQIPDGAFSFDGYTMDRQVHKSAELGVKVANAEEASNNTEKIIESAGGYLVTNSLTTGNSGIRSATLNIKVPVKQFDSAIRQISSLGTVSTKNVDGEDITDQAAAAQGRVGVMDRELAIGEARYQAAQKRAKKAETANARAEVRQLRIQAAEARGRLAYLKKLAGYSDLSVTLVEKSPTVKPMGYFEKTGNDAWASVQQAAKLPLTALIWILAYSPFWIPAILLWRKFGRARLME